jgi:hypothetical protein
MIKQRSEEQVIPASTLVAVNDHPNIWWGSTPPQGSTVVGSYSAVTVDSLDEIIEYENTGGTRFGRCYHLRRQLSEPTGAELQHLEIGSDPSYQRSYLRPGPGTSARLVAALKGNVYTNENPSVMLDLLPNLAWEDFDWSAFSYRAYQAMEPSLESNFSILNFFYEMKDLKQLHRSLKAVWNLKRGMRPGSFMSSALRRLERKDPEFITQLLNSYAYKRAPFAKVAKAVAGAHLSWEFAIRPFVGDLNRMSNIFSRLMERIKDYRDRAGIPQTRHYSEEEDAPDFSDTGFYWNANQSISVTRPLTPKIERHATMRYSYSIPYMSEITSNILGVMGQLGISPTRPSIVWNAIPFSFLIDWFYNVGDLLDKWFGHDLNPASVTVLDFCCSQKLVTKLAAQWEIGDAYAIKGSGVPVYYIESEYYQRERMVPTMSSPFSLVPSNGRKVALAASLLLAVSGKRKR